VFVNNIHTQRYRQRMSHMDQSRRTSGWQRTLQYHHYLLCVNTVHRLTTIFCQQMYTIGQAAFATFWICKHATVLTGPSCINVAKFCEMSELFIHSAAICCLGFSKVRNFNNRQHTECRNASLWQILWQTVAEIMHFSSFFKMVSLWSWLLKFWHF